MSDQSRFSLPKQQARVITTTHKTRPQMEAISSRNLLKVLPWVNLQGANYRVNRRRVVEIRPGRISFIDNGGTPEAFGPSISQMPIFREIQNQTVLDQIAASAVQEDFVKDAAILTHGNSPTHIHIIVSGKVSFFEPGAYHLDQALGTMSAGNFFGEFGLYPAATDIPFDAIAVTAVTILKIAYTDINTILAASADDQNHLADHGTFLNELNDRVNRKGESDVELFSGLHDDEPSIPSTFVEYDPNPREYELYTSQTILKIHSKIADLYNNPYNQTEEQVRLTIEELREAQEDEMINNKEFGLLHNVDYRQRIYTESGPPTPSDLDELLSRRRKTQYILAHPKAIAAFTRECTKQGIYPATIEYNGREVISWRGVPILTCGKLRVENGLTTMIAMRVGEENSGVVGLYQMGIPEEVEPSLSVRFMNIDDKAIISYLITNYYSVAVLTPDALGTLEHVEVGVH